MALNIECEERIMLSEEEYHKILTPIMRGDADAKFIIQKNDYIDTLDHFLKNNHMVLRIRTVLMGPTELTLKIKDPNGDKEYNEYLPVIALDNFYTKGIFPEGEIRNIIISMGKNVHELKVLTSLETRRYEEKFVDHLLVLDKNIYNGIEDYNLEIEAESMEVAKAKMEEYCQKYNLKYIPCKSKSRRALDTIK